MSSAICFVTPAWKRYALSEVCFEQRRRVIEALARRGVEAQCVVIADDENLDIAQRKGFATVERDNSWLDTKFNDGIQWAGQNGYDWIVPIGSDSWIDHRYFLPLPEPWETRTSPIYAVVELRRLAMLRVGRGSGAGPYMFHRSLLEPTGFRPATDGEKQRGIDGATITGIEAAGGVIRWTDRDLHRLQYVGFRGTPHLTEYNKLRNRWGKGERRTPWSFLLEAWPQDLVTAARKAMIRDQQREMADRPLTDDAA